MHARKSVGDIIDLFGGQSAVARAVSTRQSTVWRWAQSDVIPSRRIPEIIAAAARLDPPVILRPDDFFDLPTHQQPAAAPPAQATP